MTVDEKNLKAKVEFVSKRKRAYEEIDLKLKTIVKNYDIMDFEIYF